MKITGRQRDAVIRMTQHRINSLLTAAPNGQDTTLAPVN
jgi:hypothetical protein